MSELIQPILVFRGFEGEMAVAMLQVDTSRVQAETEAAFLMETEPLMAQFAAQSATVSVLMVPVDGLDSAVDALFAGLAVHSVDCDCQVHDEWAGHETPGICKGECDQHGV